MIAPSDGSWIEAPLVLLMLAAIGLMAWRLWQFLRRQRTAQGALIDRINSLLPQTQCGQCGHAGCRPYARAMAWGEAINKCPPGGATTIMQLAALLNEAPQHLDPAHGQEQEASVARIREADCIGCTKCLPVCPVDAIIGGPKLMHTVIDRECSGCDLCLAACPVDCIDMLPLTAATAAKWQPTAGGRDSEIVVS